MPEGLNKENASPEENKTEEVTAEKVAKSLNAATEAKEVAEKVEGKVEETNETLKSLVNSLNETVKSLSESKEDEKVAELKSKVDLLEAQNKEAQKGYQRGGIPAPSEEQVKKSKEFVEAFVKACNTSKNSTNKSISFENSYESLSGIKGNRYGNLDLKSLVSFDNTNAGHFVNDMPDLGITDVNTKPVVGTLTSRVRKVSAPHNVITNEIDLSFITTSESKEIQAKENSDVYKLAQKIIKQDQHSAKVPVSDVVLHLNMSDGFSTDPIALLLGHLEDEFELGKDRKIVTDFISTAQKSTTKINKQLTATANTLTVDDLIKMVSPLKPLYTSNLNSTAYVLDIKAFDEIFLEKGNDGHGVFEYFDYKNKLAGLKTSRGVIDIVGIDSRFFKDYFAFDNSLNATTNKVTEGYDNSVGADNTGKVVGMLVDLNRAYTLVSSPASMLQVDNSFADQLTKGYVWAGKIGYYGGEVILEEATTLLVIRNS